MLISDLTLSSNIIRAALGWVNVVEEGATGDGSTNDATVFIAAIAKAAAYLPGGTVFVPSRSTGSTYLIGTSLTIPSNVTVLMSGGARLSVSVGVTVLVQGRVVALGLASPYTGSGTVSIGMANFALTPFGLTAGTPGTVGVWIDPVNGRLGINTSTPSQTLDVNGITRLRGDVYGSTNARIFQFEAQADSASWIHIVTGADTPANGIFFGQEGQAKGSLNFGIVGESTAAEAAAETGAAFNFLGNTGGQLNNVLQLVPIIKSGMHGENFIRIKSGADTDGPEIIAVGSGVAFMPLLIGVQDLGAITFGANMGNNQILVLRSVLSSLEGVDLNHIELTNSLTGVGPTISTAGVDATVDLNVSLKGGGRVVFAAGIGLTLGLANHNVSGTLNLGAFATRSVTNPTNAINIFNGTAGSGTLTNGITLEAASGELFVRNAAGLATKLSLRAKGVTGAISTGATVTHGLGATPTTVLVTAADSGPTDVYVSAIGGTTFAINYGGGGTHVFGWSAEA